MIIAFAHQTNMINFILLFNRFGRIRLQRWFVGSRSPKACSRIIGDIVPQILKRKLYMCNVLEWKDKKIIYRKYANLIFCFCIDRNDNELLALEAIHRFVQVLDMYYNNVCELDVIYNVKKSYEVMDELFLAGEMQEPSKTSPCTHLWRMDELESTTNECETTMTKEIEKALRFQHVRF